MGIMAKDTLETVSEAEIKYGDKSVKLPMMTGTEGETAVDITKLRGQTGIITMDPGFANTGSCKSAITFINGEEGILHYRGYPIADLANNSNFLESSYLVMNGELPTADQLKAFREEITYHTLVHESFRRFFESFPKDAHPMPTLAAAIASLATFYPAPETDEEIQIGISRLIGKMPTLAAYAYKYSVGQPFVYPRNDLDYTSNFLNMMFATPAEAYKVDPVIAKALDLLLILHIDHEQNCSTSTVRLVGSSQAHLFASISAGISALWGPLHGGANQKVLEMLESIAEQEGTAEKFMTKAKDKDDTTRLMGFGHRVYKNYDPRASILKAACQQVIDRTPGTGKLIEIAMDLEKIALSDEYFIKRKLYPNVDYYSGIIYQALGIPIPMFTVMFALGRLPGWIAQWLEMRKSPDFKIGRPRQIYVGKINQKYVPIEKRS
jgi:citrate synthase